MVSYLSVSECLVLNDVMCDVTAQVVLEVPPPACMSFDFLSTLGKKNMASRLTQDHPDLHLSLDFGLQCFVSESAASYGFL